MNAPTRTRIGILLLPHFSLAELGLILEPLFIVNWLLQEKRFQWRLFGVEGESVVSASGIRIDVEPELPEAETLDMIFILASFEPKTYAGDRRAKIWLRRAAAAGVELCGVETGMEFLAAAGLLNGRRAAVHWDNLDGFRELYPEVDARPELYAIDAGRMSCAGGTAVVDLMFQWLRPKLDKAIFAQLRSHMLESRIRPGGLPQLGHHAEEATGTHPAVRRALDLMERTVEEPLSTSEIASRIGISVRQLERRFREEKETSPSKYYMRLRITRAHRLLQQTDLTVAEIAAGTGFQSMEHFSRVYRRYYGCAPSRDRVQATEAPSIPRES